MFNMQLPSALSSVVIILYLVAQGSVNGQLCTELFEGQGTLSLSDDGTFKVGDIIKNYSAKIYDVTVTLTCTRPTSDIFILNGTDIILGTDLKLLPCTGNAERAACSIKCVEPGQQDYDNALEGVISRTDHADPYFKKSHYYVNVSEYTRKGATIFDFHGQALDDDCLSKDVGFNFNIETQHVTVINMLFQGAVILNESLDYESENKSFVFNISVSHDGKEAYTLLTINVQDEDDMDPAFINDTYTLKIMEENSTLTSLWLSTSPPIHAEDLDKGAGKQNVSYFFKDMLGDNGVFLINSESGEVKPKHKLDREKKAKYEFIIQATQDNNHLRSATATLVIEVLDVNDNQPMFNKDFHDITIPENSPSGMSVLTVTATDKDEGENAVTTYTVDVNPFFEVDRVTGVVRVKPAADIDREKHHTFNVTIKATDKQSGLVGGNTTLVVTVTDVNDNAPVFTSKEYQFHIGSSKLIGKIQANDVDEGNNSLISYSIFETPDGKYFTIDDDGNLSRSDEVIPTTKDSFIVIVVAQDHGFPQLESIVTVTISQTLVEGDNVIIGTPLSLDKLQSRQKEFESDIGKIINLVVAVVNTKANAHSIGSSLYISAKYSNSTVVKGDDLLSIVTEHMGEIQALFLSNNPTVSAQESKSMTTAEIALIIVAGVIFCGSLLAIVILFRKYQNLQRYNQLNDHLRRRSSLYESQEIKVKLEDETSDYDGSLNTQEVEADSSTVIVGKEGLVAAFSNPVYADDEQTNVKLSSANGTNENNAVEKAEDSNDIEETLSSLDDALDTEDVKVPRVDYENTRLKGDGEDTENLIDLNDGENGTYEETFSQNDRASHGVVSAQFDNGHDNTNEENKDKEDDDDDPPPDYNVKEVRFSAQVLDTDENKFEPLKKEEIPNAAPEDVDGEAQIIDNEGNEDDRDDNIPHFADESDRMDEEIISPVDFLKPENKDENGANLGTFHFGLDSSHDMEITKF